MYNYGGPFKPEEFRPPQVPLTDLATLNKHFQISFSTWKEAHLFMSLSKGGYRGELDRLDVIATYWLPERVPRVMQRADFRLPGPAQMPVCASGEVAVKDPQIFIPALNRFLSMPITAEELRTLIGQDEDAAESKGKGKKKKDKEAKADNGGKGIATRAPLGRGTETVLDLKARKCWQLDTSQFVVSSAEFNWLLTRTGVERNSPMSEIESSMYAESACRDERLCFCGRFPSGYQQKGSEKLVLAHLYSC